MSTQQPDDRFSARVVVIWIIAFFIGVVGMITGLEILYFIALVIGGLSVIVDYYDRKQSGQKRRFIDVIIDIFTSVP